MYDALVIVPAFNESKSIGAVIEGLLRSGVSADIAVINDGSSDHSEQIIQRYPVMCVSHPCNLGYGAALQTGYQLGQSLGYRFIVQFDGDGQHSVDDLIRVLAELRSGEADVVIGSRFLEANRRVGLIKRAAIRMFRTMILLCTGQSVTDPTSGLKGLSRSVFSHYARMREYPSDYPDADIIIDILLEGWSITEIPIGSYERSFGTSMHAGIRPLIYMGKVLLSVFVVVVNHRMNRRVVQP